jgi:hypothetical protein
LLPGQARTQIAVHSQKTLVAETPWHKLSILVVAAARLVTPKRLGQHSIETKLPCVAKLSQSNGHAFMTRLGLRVIGVEESCPS